MSQLGLIIEREYKTRVLKKSFILATLLTPLLIGLLIFGAGYMANKGSKSTKHILLADDSHVIKKEVLKDKSQLWTLAEKNVEELKKSYTQLGYDVLIHIPAWKDSLGASHQVSYYSKEKMGILQLQGLENDLEKIFKTYKIDQSSINKTDLDKLNIDIKLENALLTEKDKSIVGDKSSKFSSAIATGLSYAMGFLMYMVIFIFGSMVMRSVMEEKISRIVEVMISSVKPYDLMLGKIIGVGLVGLTQLAIWLIFIPLMMYLANLFFGVDPSMMPQGNLPPETAAVVKDLGSQDPTGFANMIKEFMALNWSLIIPVFIIFFFGGYFIYSAMFAAVGSAVGDDIGDSQQLMLPLSAPVIIALVMLPSVFNNPDGPIAIFGSMFPLLSPILMPARLPFNPPLWQIGLSILFLILGIMVITWVAARIYRVGILMYGKKVSFKELGKWIFYKD
jgi:ABC-2 type transport system permease protein